MAYRERQKISQMTPKGADLSATDLVEISVLESGSYVTKSVTGLEIINAASGGALDLQIVTDNGNTTTNDLIVSVENPNDKTTVSDQYVKTENGTSGTYTSITAIGGLQLKVGDEESQLKNTNVTNADVVLEFPNKPTGSYTIATTEDVTTPTLQDVTDAGNTTTTQIIVSDGTESTYVTTGGVNTENTSENTYATLSNGGELRLKAGAEVSTLMNSNVTNAGVTLEFPNKTTGVYTIATTSDLSSGYIPYTGATQNADLGEYELKAGQLSLDVSPTGTAAVGTTRWNNNLGSSETTLKGGTVILKNGVDLVARVVNKVVPNATLTKANYTAVKVSGAQGQMLAVDYAKADADLNSADTIGLVTETIATNQEGFIITVGQIEDINTTGSLQSETWADGDVLYLSPTTAGALTNIKPTGATGHIVVIGYVEYAHAVHGKIYVKIMNGWELDELHNVYINTGTLANNDALIYESSTQLWKNKTIATALGYTPVTNARTISTSAPLSGGGDLTANRTLSISQATTSTDGYLSSTDWNTFNNKASYTPRVQSVTSSATVTPVNTNDLVKITAQAAGLTFANPTGTWDEGQSLMIRIKDNGTARAISYGTKYRAIGVTLPTTTVLSKTTYLGLIYNATDDFFDVIGVTTQA